MWSLGHSRIKHLVAVGVITTVLVIAQPGRSQAPALSPAELVRKTVQNEMKAGTDSSPSYMFLSRKETSHGSQTKMMVETRDAMAGMLVAINDQPLTPAQRQAEEDHLHYLASHPEELRRKQKQEKEDADRVGRILRAMPDAFLYEPDSTEAGTPGVGKPGKELVRLKFRPNPKYDPPTRVEQVLTGMQGQILIDPHQNRIAKIDGTLFRDVGFGWGILGHLDRGGRFEVHQGAVDDDGWEMTRIKLEFTGKVLLFKSIAINSTETFSDFHQVSPDLSFAQGVGLLEKETGTGSHNGGK